MSVRAAYADATASFVQQSPEGDLLVYPFLGVRFLIRGDRVLGVEVLRGETTSRAPVAAPSSGANTPAIQVPGGWSVRAMSTRVEETPVVALVVEGRVENHSRPLTVYADVHVFNRAGREIGEGSSPVYPNPVRLGGDAAFEVRVPIDDVVHRYVVTIRPVGSSTISLAEGAAEIKDFKPFAPIVAKQIQATVQTPTRFNANRRDFTLVAINGSSLVVATASVTVEIEALCLGFREVHTGTVTVEQLRPGATAQLPIQLQDGPCPGFATWSTKTRVGSVKIGD